MRTNTNHGRDVYDIWSHRYLLMAIAGSAAALLMIVWFIVHDGTAEAEDMQEGMASLHEECRSYGAMALRLEILKEARPLDRDEVEDILAPIGDLEAHECAKINEQLGAIAQ